MHPLIRFLAALAAALVAGAGPGGAAAGSSGARSGGSGPLHANGRIALVPLDDRPVSLHYPAMVAAVADAEVVTPPRGVLGRFLKTGDGDAVARWLDAVDVSAVDAVVVSADMLAYGGLVGSRVARVFEADARRRIDAVAGLKQRRPALPVFVFSTIMRLAPTADGGNQAWREAIARWAQIAPQAASDPSLAAEAARLEAALPAGMLDRYRAARARNLAINLRLVELAAHGAVDLLVFGQDDAGPAGVHVSDRQAIAAAIGAAGVGARAVVQTGADELASLLVVRALLARGGQRPAVHVTYSSEAHRDVVMPFEDRPLGQTISALVATSGAAAADTPRPDTVRLFVYASRHDAPGAADGFAALVSKAASAGRRVAVADIDTRGDVQGSSLPFVEALRAHKVLPRLSGYASWNTAGNTVGLALAHGLAAALAGDTIAAADAARRASAAHLHALMLRLTNDFLYQGVVRAQVNDDVVRARGLDPMLLDDRGRARVEATIQQELRPLAESLLADFAAQAWRLPGTGGRRPFEGLLVGDLERFDVSLPWSRLFEADIRLEIGLAAESQRSRAPRPRVLR